MPSRIPARVAVLIFLAATVTVAQTTLLNPAHYRHYVTTFEADELAATGKIYNGEPSTASQPPEAAWPWMQHEIPFFDCPDKATEEMYYFRWYAFKKHVVHTPTGYVITEWLPKPNFPTAEHPDGSYGALVDAAPFHLDEARWLRTRAIAEDDARFWYKPDVPGSPDIRKYSAAMATAVRAVTLANGDNSLATSLLPQLTRVYRDWETAQQDPNGLFWSIDTRDAMEKSISGDGYRPTLNSYMVSDARAIAATALLTHNQRLANEYTAKADKLNHLIETVLWNPKDQFYEVVSPTKDSGIRAQKKFVDPGTVFKLAGVRELIGYNPWNFSSPAPDHAVAWNQLFDPQGFNGKYGATTAERRSPRFRFASSDQCTWNGPAWPFAMTQTLNTMATYLNSPGNHTIGFKDYRLLFSRYVLAQHLRLANGKLIDWIDEDYDADTDEWIAKDMLIQKHKQIGRGNYYNHSGFADPLITGLIGLRPRADNTIELNPAIDPKAWPWFAIDALPYHNHLVTIAWDSTGQRYHHGRGLWIAVDGKVIARRATLGHLSAALPQQVQTAGEHLVEPRN